MRAAKLAAHVDRADNFVGNSRSDVSLPTGDERRARAAFPHAVFATAIRARRFMVAELLDGVVLVAVV